MSTLSLATVKDYLFNKEAHRKEMGVDADQALVPEKRGQSKSTRPKGKGKGHERSQSKETPTCWKCKTTTHTTTHENMNKRTTRIKKGQ